MQQLFRIVCDCDVLMPDTITTVTCDNILKFAVGTANFLAAEVTKSCKLKLPGCFSYSKECSKTNAMAWEPLLTVATYTHSFRSMAKQKRHKFQWECVPQFPSRHTNQSLPTAHPILLTGGEPGNEAKKLCAHYVVHTIWQSLVLYN